MSWNWNSSTVRQAASSSVRGYGRPVRSAAVAAHSSASRSSASLRRLPCLVRSCEVNTPRWSSSAISPVQTGGSGYSASASRKNAIGVSMRTRGDPSRSAVRWAAAIISRVGPPPPSPHPNGTSETVARPFSLKFRSAWASSAPLSSEMYESTGGKCV